MHSHRKIDLKSVAAACQAVHINSPFAPIVLSQKLRLDEATGARYVLHSVSAAGQST